MGKHKEGRTDLSSEREFLEKLRSREREAFRLLVEMHQDMVWNLALRMVKQRELAEDLSQEIFLRVYKALPSFRGGSSLSTWIYRITWNVVMTEMQKPCHRDRMEALDEIVEDSARSVHSVHPASDPLSELERSDTSRRVNELMERLAPRQKMALALFYQGGKSYKEISQIMDVPMGTVKTLVFRAKESMRAMLAKLDDNGLQ